MAGFTYKGNKTKEISFPLGGIGTGSIGLSGNGRLVDWEIFNRPDKGSINGFTHFAVKAEKSGKVLDARVLNGDLQSSYIGGENSVAAKYTGFGFGPQRTTMAGVPHFKDCEFKGEYPLAELKFIQNSFPGDVKMTAFNPFIPLNDKDSSIPGAFFEIEVENTTEEMLSYTVSLAVNNMLPAGTTVNTYGQKEGVHFINLASAALEEKDAEFGELTAAVYAEEVSCQEYWYRGKWFDSLGVYWREFTSPGKLNNRKYPKPENRSIGKGKGEDMCTLAAHMDIEPGRKKAVRFVLTWNFPNNYNYWNPEKEECCCGGNCGTVKPKTWRNYYAAVFKNSIESALYSLKNWDRLYSETLEFKEALFSSSLPDYALDAVSANISILKTSTCLRLEDGSFYGWEGCHCNEGCCEGSCTHVWNYAYALPFLFPKLERSMRDLDFKYNQGEDGGMSFRLQLPLGRERTNFRPCVDGQFGGVIKAYRDWKICGDTAWLKANWEAIKKSIDFAWAETNYDRWDYNRDGVLEGRQHHTLDMELFGPSSWLNGFYLAALKAGAEMAELFGEGGKAKEYRELFEKGKLWVDTNLFNGEYYKQIIDIKDRSLLEQFSKGLSLHGDTAEEAYWNQEAKEIKYQIADGCSIDQVLAQWHANLCGLGEIFDREQTQKALKAIYKNNFKRSFRDFFNACRLYSLNDEAGVVICDWPEGKYKPVVPITYAEETMNGFEYQVAIHMIQEGFVEEGFEIVKAIRDRYDGERRNPWNEFECGSNYARSMASYALLPAISGFEYNMAEGMLGFDPAEKNSNEFNCFWSMDSGWGLFSRKGQQTEIKVLYGDLRISKLKLGYLGDYSVSAIHVGDRYVKVNQEGEYIKFEESVIINKGNSLTVQI